MFTHIPRTGNPLGGKIRKAVAMGAAFAVGTGVALVAVPTAASADEEVPTSYAEAQFLSGSLLGGDLADVVALASDVAYNDGTQDKVTSKDTLNATVLDSVNLTVPGGVQVPLGSYVNAGAVNQYAEANRGGQSFASSGAIGGDGAIGVGPVGSGTAGDLSIDLNSLLGDSYASIISDLRLSLEAVAASATGDLNTASGDYTLADATLNLTSPAIANLTQKVLTSLGVVDDRLGSLNGSNGILAVDVSGLIAALGLVATPTVSVSLSADVEAAVRPLLTGTYGDGAVSFNLETGTVQIDLEALLGGDLNDLPPNTEILTDAVIGPVLRGITTTIDNLIDSIITRVDETLRQARLDVDVDLEVLTPQMGTANECLPVQIPVVGPVGSTVQDVVNGLVGGTIGGTGNGLPLGQVLPGVGGVLSGLFGGGSTTPVTQPTEIVGYLTNTVCNIVSTVVGQLNTSVHVDVHGTVQQILNGGQGTATATATVLGIPVSVDIDGILDGLLGNLTDVLFDNDGAVQAVLDALNLNLLDPATEGLLGVAGIDIALTDVLSIKVNVQETRLASARGMATVTGSMFTETAVRVSALGVATINVAAATVGPNINRVVDPDCTTNCGPDGPDCVTNCGPGGPDNPGSTSANGGRLAMTGVGIATLVAVILALLAAGAYLAREGYRRNHPQSL